MRVVNNMRFGLIYIQCSHLTASVCKCKNNHARARIIIRGTIIHTLVCVHFARHANSARAIKYNVSDRKRAKNMVLVRVKIRRRYINI
jgi:hypothetical protein